MDGPAGGGRREASGVEKVFTAPKEVIIAPCRFARRFGPTGHQHLTAGSRFHQRWYAINLECVNAALDRDHRAAATSAWEISPTIYTALGM